MDQEGGLGRDRGREDAGRTHASMGCHPNQITRRNCSNGQPSYSGLRLVRSKQCREIWR
ncbi:protein of unknown function [Methylocella tundrae]|uniref:Uncharacterized protein n=1 Tax=Methylocella tundrae TaxID=227605 RepID=A0A4U8Z0G4_METTU|nr:protein of unknown function [Methylocella tundrae]